jgi:hypothetical protein
MSPLPSSGGLAMPDQPIVGSAEPLSPEETRQRLQELAAWGVDLSLVEVSLHRTPTERAEHMVGLLRLIEDLKQGFATRKAKQKETAND